MELRTNELQENFSWIGEPTTVIVIDGKNFCLRQHFAHTALQNKEGEASGMCHGALVEILRINKLWPESPMIFCWDGRGPNWRHKLSASYKGNRKPSPDKDRLESQIRTLLPLLSSLGFHVLNVDGIEADDMIGIVSYELEQSGKEVVIYSTDRDMYQLVSDKVKVWTKEKGKDITVDLKYVKNWLGAAPSAIIDIRAMAGDVGDNLKGLPGIGPKKAVALYQSGIKPSGNEEKARLFLGPDLYTHWGRVKQEYKLATIIKDKVSDLLTEEQKKELSVIVKKVLENPGRKEKESDVMQASLYEFIGRYELEEVFKKRTQFWKIP